jgi:opacity protein-like surface antigen
MKLIATLATLVATLAAAAAAQTPDVRTIMENVGRNQAQAVALRQEFTFHQRQLLKMNRGNGKVAREEHREYEITPKGHGVAKELLRFDGKYEYKGKYVTYDRPGYNYKDMDIDGDLIDDLSNDMTNDKGSRDGIGANLFPLTTEEQHKYNFKLLAAEPYRGRDVYRVSFEPKPHQDFDEAAWKGEAMIDAAEFQPVSIHSKLALKIPKAVKVLLGTDIKGLGFAVTYQKFEDGVWFPVSYGGEFEVRAVFFYKRTISVNMTNTEFHRTNVNSNVTYLANEK